MSRATLLAVFLCISASYLLAQRTTAQIVGTITDSSSGTISHAQVNVINEGTGIRRNASTNDLGNYSVPLLPPGNYRITVQSQGFHPVTRTGVTLAVDQTARIDFVLQVGEVVQTVEVSANASLVDTQTATLKAVVDQRRIQELPLNGRDPNQLIFLLPGVYATNDTSGLQQAASGAGIVQPGVASNGARGNMVSYALDGAFHNDTYVNVSLPMPNPDALQEFSVQTNNFSAEYGHSAGGVVNAVTRSGTNTLHGNLFEFIRNNAVNARNFFATTDDGLKRNQFGGSLGGPVYLPHIYSGHDRTFFFLSYQETRQVQRPATGSQTVLTGAQRNGDFSAYRSNIIDPTNNQPFPNKQIPLGRENPLTRNVLDKLIPLPTEPTTGLFWFTRPNNLNIHQLVTKVDHKVAANNTLTARYLYNYYLIPGYDVPLVFAVTRESQVPSHNVSVSDTHIFSPTLLNEAQFSLNRRRTQRVAVWATSLKQLGMKNVFSDSPDPVEFALSVSGAFAVDTSEMAWFKPYDTTFSDVIRWSKGRHEMSMGFEYRFQSLDKNDRWQLDPSVSFSGYASGYGVADFFLGLPSGFVQSAYGQVGKMHAPSYAGFFQDSIRVTRRLTINAGLRYEPFTPYVDDGNRVSAFLPGQQSQVFVKAPAGLVYPGDPGVPRGGTESSPWNFAPRFGFAWSPFADNRTSIRGGYGIFYDSGVMSAIANVFQNVAPFGTGVSLSPPPGPFDDPYLGNNPFPMPFPPPKDIAFLSGQTIATYPHRFKIGYMQDWNLTVERELVPNLLMRIGYAGSKGTDLLQGQQLNPAIYIPGQSTIANANSRRPYYPAFTSITQVGSDGNSTFHSLQLALDKHFSRGFTVLANYTWAKSIDYGSGAGTLWPTYRDPWDHSLDRGRSDFDRKHRFVVSGLWELPALKSEPRLLRAVAGGWSLAGVLTMQSGAAFAVRSGVDNSRSGMGLDLADLVGDISRPEGVDKVRTWYNTAAFVSNAIGTFGSSGRNIVPGPGMAVVNTTLAKYFNVYRETKLQFRAEFFNLTNHPNFIAARSDSVTSGTFGRITSADDPRILQFGLKWQF